MAKGRSPLVIIFITIFIDAIGFAMIVPVLPLYAERFGASALVIGLLLSAYSIMQFVFAPILGKLSDRVGRRPVLLVSLIGTAVGFGIMGLAATLAWLFVGRIIDGISGGNISTARAYIADLTRPEDRSRGMGLMGAAFGLGYIIGPAIGGVLSSVSAGAPFYFSAGLAGANALALYFLLPESLSMEHRSKAGHRASLREVFEEGGNSPLKVILVTNFFVMVAFTMLAASYALFAKRRFDFDASHTGYMFAYLGLLGTVIQAGMIGRLSKLFGDKAMAITGAIIFIGSMFMLPVGSTITMLVIASTGIAIGFSLVGPTINALASNSVSAAWQGRVLGVMASSASLAAIIGPTFGDWLLGRDAVNGYEHYGRTPFWTSGAIMFVALGLVLTVRSERTRAKEELAKEEAAGVT
jgi:DHA1 family tetracycline resistance protein-like MFS transporter